MEDTKLDHAQIADLLRQHPGKWVALLTDDSVRAHSRMGNWRLGSNKRPKVYTPRFTFRCKSNGYASYTATIYARYDPVTFELDAAAYSATIGGADG